MRCEDARDLLLTADPAELDGRRPGPLASHLETCPACGAAAARIVAATRALRAERAVRPAAVAAATARAEALRLARARRTRRAITTLAAAAGFAAILLLREGPHAGRPVAPGQIPSPPLVESNAGHVAILTTDNPAIVVVWQF